MSGLLFFLCGLSSLRIDQGLLFALLGHVHVTRLSDLLGFLDAIFLCFCLHRLRNCQPTILSAWGVLRDALRELGHFFLSPAGAVVLVSSLFLFLLFICNGLLCCFAVRLVHHKKGDPLEPGLNACARRQKFHDRLELLDCVEFLLDALNPEPIVLSSLQLLGTQFDQFLALSFVCKLGLLANFFVIRVFCDFRGSLVLLSLFIVLSDLLKLLSCGNLEVAFLILFALFFFLFRLTRQANTRIAIVCHF